jgi:hypothetical protein
MGKHKKMGIHCDLSFLGTGFFFSAKLSHKPVN